MVSFEAARLDASNHRDPDAIGDFNNVLNERIMLKAYGPTIKNFKTPTQLLECLRAAILGKHPPFHCSVISSDHES